MEKGKKPRIKITYIIPSLNKGGAERFLVDLIANLDLNIYEPSVILFKCGGDWVRELEALNIPVTIFQKKKKIDVRNFIRIYQALKEIKPQIVHTKLGGDIYGRLAAKLLGVPVIVSTEENVGTGESFYFYFFKKITNGWVNKIIAVSQAVKKNAIKRYGLTPDKIIVIPNGVNIGKFLADKKNKRVDSPAVVRVGTIGRLVPQKDHETLIQAWKLIKSDKIKCAIAGVGPLAKKLSSQIKENGLTDEISLIGPVSNPASFLSSLDIFVLPSLWEGQGIVLLEAGLAGLPIIVSAIDGVSEVIDESTGWLVPAGDFKALAAKIEWVANNIGSLEVRNKIDKLQRHILKNYDLKQVSLQYQDLYQSLLKETNTYENFAS